MDKFGKLFQNLVFRRLQLSDLNKDMKVKCKIFYSSFSFPCAMFDYYFAPTEPSLLQYSLTLSSSSSVYFLNLLLPRTPQDFVENSRFLVSLFPLCKNSDSKNHVGLLHELY